MNPDYDKQLETAISRELKALPELAAPTALASRVMAAIEQRARVPWYRRSWQTWPVALRGVSFVGLLAAFAILCFGSWRLAHFATLTPAAREVSGWFSLVNAVWNAANILANALGLAFRSLGPAVAIGSAVMLLISYTACVGLGTVYWRLAFCASLKERSL
jgi:hypothetical protein